ncbi:MAG: outer membrane beta-barrel protein [Hyphomicrobiales bacterium]
MKHNYKLLLILFILLISYINTNGQERRWKRFELGPRIGIAMSAAIPFPLSDVPKGANGSPELNTSLGVFSFVNINDTWAIGLGFDVVKNSFNFDAKVVSQRYTSINPITGIKIVQYYTGPTKGSFEFNFIEFPLIARYKFSELFNAHFGLYFSYIYLHQFGVTAVGGKTGLNPDPDKQSPIPRFQYDFDDDLRNFDWGLTGGVSKTIIKHLEIGLMLDAGLNNIFQKNFKSLDYKMYQVHLRLNLTYNLL